MGRRPDLRREEIADLTPERLRTCVGDFPTPFVSLREPPSPLRARLSGE